MRPSGHDRHAGGISPAYNRRGRLHLNIHGAYKNDIRPGEKFFQKRFHTHIDESQWPILGQHRCHGEQAQRRNVRWSMKKAPCVLHAPKCLRIGWGNEKNFHATQFSCLRVGLRSKRTALRAPLGWGGRLTSCPGEVSKPEIGSVLINC